MLQRIKVILVGTTHSGNVGSTARAMKTMGLSQLCLVAPECEIDAQAVALSAGAEDVLQNITIYSDLASAIADCHLELGASARLRHLQQTLVEPRTGAKRAIETLQNPESKVALVFGRERVGLTNDELLQCNNHVFIPTNPDYRSLNLAMAAQILCYEMRQAWLEQTQNPITESIPQSPRPAAAALQYFFQQTEKFYTELGFIKNRAVMDKLQHLYQRADLSESELNLLNGMLATVQKTVGRNISTKNDQFSQNKQNVDKS